MKKYQKRFLAAFFFMMAVFSFSGRNCQAAGLEQTDASAHSVTVRWDLREGALHYLIYVGTCNADSSLYAAVDDSVMKIKIRGLPEGSSSYIRVDYEYRDRSGAVRTKLAGYTASARTLPGTVQNVRQTGWYDRAESCSVEWDRMDCADGYEYVVRNRKGRKIAAGKIRSNTGTARINRIVASEICTISVRACITVGGKETYGEWSDPCYLFAQPRILTAIVSGNRLIIRWGRVKGAAGYDIYMSSEGTAGYEKVKSAGKSADTVTITQFRGKEITEKNIYYVYVTAKKKAGAQLLSGGRYFYKNTENDDTGYFHENNRELQGGDF